jgi:dTDP-D-glucose 4,6-dehydratase
MKTLINNTIYQTKKDAVTSIASNAMIDESIKSVKKYIDNNASFGVKNIVNHIVSNPKIYGFNYSDDSNSIKKIISKI